MGNFNKNNNIIKHTPKKNVLNPKNGALQDDGFLSKKVNISCISLLFVRKKFFSIVASCKSSVVLVWKKMVVSNGDLLHGRIR